MNRKLASVSLLAGAVLFAIAGLAYSIAIGPSSRGGWPASWPAELEPLRDHATTLKFMSATDEDIHQINFEDRKEFEKLWPVILSLKTPGAPVTLSAIRKDVAGAQIRYSKPSVIIYTPPAGPHEVNVSALTMEQRRWLTATMGDYTSATVARRQELRNEAVRSMQALRTGPPWPAELLSPSGALPEYVDHDVIDGKAQWVPSTDGTGFRARVEIELVVDGKIIDLNRIQFSPDTPIIDQRFVSPNGRDEGH